MGASNVLRVSHNWGHLDGTAFKLAVRMAVVIKDTEQYPCWFGGLEPLADALGRHDPPPTDTSESAQRYRAQTEKAIKRGTAKLRAAGALAYRRRPRYGVQAEWWAWFDGPPGFLAVDNRPQYPAWPLVLGTHEGSALGTHEGSALGTHEGSAIGVLRSTEEYSRKTSPEVTTSPASVDEHATNRCCDDFGWRTTATGAVTKCPIHYTLRSVS